MPLHLKQSATSVFLFDDLFAWKKQKNNHSSNTEIVFVMQKQTRIPSLG